MKPIELNVKSINSLLESHSKERLLLLRREFPEYPDLFDPMRRLGASRGASGASRGVEGAVATEPRRVDAIRALALSGLEVANKRIPFIVNNLSRRLKFVRAMKLFGGIIAAISSAGVISALALSNQKTAMITACLGFTSSITALVGEHLEKPFGGGDRGSLLEYLQQILNAEKSVNEVSLRLTAEDGDMVALAREVNEIASSIRSVEIYAGVET
jgi:hypothetical protein